MKFYMTIALQKVDRSDTVTEHVNINISILVV